MKASSLLRTINYRWFIAIALGLFLNSCYVGRNLHIAVTMRIPSAFEASNVSTLQGHDQWYVGAATTDSLKAVYLTALESTLTNSNVKLIYNDTAKVDYELRISWLKFDENHSITTVEDEASEYNGSTYELAEVEVDAEVTLFNMTTQQSDGSWIISADKEEKITNNRSLGQLIFGQNQDRSEYRQKLLDDNVIVTLAAKCGRRTADKTTGKLGKMQNKQ